MLSFEHFISSFKYTNTNTLSFAINLCAKEFDKNVILRSNYFAGSTLLVDVLLFEVRVVECNLVWSQDFYIENRFGSFCKYSFLCSGFYIVVFNQLSFKSRRSFTRPPGGSVLP